MTKILEKERAQHLRKRGLSIGSIANKVGVSKSTVSYWCRDITLSHTQIKHIGEQQKKAAIGALLMSAERKRMDRISRTKHLAQRGSLDIGKVSKRDLFLLGLALYWGEGYKKGNDEFGFTNSDPVIIKIIIKWLKDIYGVGKEDLILRVSINQLHIKRERIVTKYWEGITEISKSQFTKMSFIKTISMKRYSNHNEHFGTLRVKVRRGADLRRRILGSIDALGGIVSER